MFSISSSWWCCSEANDTHFLSLSPVWWWNRHPDWTCRSTGCSPGGSRPAPRPPPPLTSPSWPPTQRPGARTSWQTCRASRCRGTWRGTRPGARAARNTGPAGQRGGPRHQWWTRRTPNWSLAFWDRIKIERVHTHLLILTKDSDFEQ